MSQRPLPPAFCAARHAVRHESTSVRSLAMPLQIPATRRTSDASGCLPPWLADHPWHQAATRSPAHGSGCAGSGIDGSGSGGLGFIGSSFAGCPSSEAPTELSVWALGKGLSVVLHSCDLPGCTDATPGVARVLHPSARSTATR